MATPRKSEVGHGLDLAILLIGIFAKKPPDKRG